MFPLILQTIIIAQMMSTGQQGLSGPQKSPIHLSLTFCFGFSCFCTAHSRELLYFTASCLFPLKTAPSRGYLSGLPFTFTWYLGSTRVLNPNGISIGVSRFCTAHRRVSAYFTIGRPSLLKTAPARGHLDPHHGSLGPHRFSSQTTHRSVQMFSRAHDRQRQTDRQTDMQIDRPCYSVCCSRRHRHRVHCDT